MKRVKILTSQLINTANGARYLVNGSLWINQIELNNLMRGAGLSVNTPAMALKGSFLEYEEVIITPEMVVNGTNFVSIRARTNRAGETIDKITYKTPGAKQYQFSLELSDFIMGKMVELSVAQGAEELATFNENARLRSSMNAGNATNTQSELPAQQENAPEGEAEQGANQGQGIPATVVEDEPVL